jgi:SAM-dependent methyltransferase
MNSETSNQSFLLKPLTLRREDLWKIYDEAYSLEYNDRYLVNPFSKVSADTELRVLRSLISPDTQWLDLGCGTGYFLSQFPGIQRAGLDISPEMIRLATRENPDALFLREGDFRKENSEWDGAWTLITCMWAAYSYVDSIQEAEQLIRNMISWTRSGGSIFLPIIDVEDIRPNTNIPYEMEENTFGGKIEMTGVTWTWKEENGTIHEHLVAPHTEHFIKMLMPFFDKIEVVRYPPYMLNWTSRKALLATGRRQTKDGSRPAEIVWHPVPEVAVKSSGHVPYDDFRAMRLNLSNKQLVGELFFRIRSGYFFKSLARKIYHKLLGK